MLPLHFRSTLTVRKTKKPPFLISIWLNSLAAINHQTHYIFFFAHSKISLFQLLFGLSSSSVINRSLEIYCSVARIHCQIISRSTSTAPHNTNTSLFHIHKIYSAIFYFIIRYILLFTYVLIFKFFSLLLLCLFRPFACVFDSVLFHVRTYVLAL